MAALKGIDLRRASLADHVIPPLAGVRSRTQRIQVLKALYGWLRRELHTVTAAQDPTLGALSVPQAMPAQWKRTKAIQKPAFELVVRYLGDRRAGDLLRVLGGTGWHVTELERFAQSGEVEAVPAEADDAASAGVLVLPLTKGGEMLRTRVSPDVLEAAQRVRAAGPFSRSLFDKAVKSACVAVGVPLFLPANMRHTVATWAVNSGADPGAVAAFLGHRSPRTTRRFYATHASPAKVPTLI